MIKTSDFEAELAAGMHSELLKQASAEQPKFAKAAECLHAALEIFESAGMTDRADQVLKVLQKIAQSNPYKQVHQIPSITQLMQAGMTQRDMQEFSKGSPIAKAKLNLVLRGLGLGEHQIGKLIGKHNVMSEEDAKAVLDPSAATGKIWEWIKNPNAPIDQSNVRPGETLDFKSLAQKKSPKIDHATKGLTPEKMVANLKHHGTEFNMADQGCAVDIHEPFNGRPATKDDMDADFAGLLDSPSFDIDASDDELMGIEIQEDSLEVFDKEIPLEDFEDE